MGAHTRPGAARHRRVRAYRGGSPGLFLSTARPCLPPTLRVREVQEGDDLALLSAHALWALAFRAAAAAAAAAPAPSPESMEPPSTCLPARALITESLLLLEAAVAVSPHNAQLRLAAARACGWLGHAAGVMRHLPALRIKHQALDSLAHPVFTQVRPRLLHARHPSRPPRVCALPSQVHRLCAPDALTQLCEALDRFRSGALSEIPDYVRVSLRSGVFSSALDMMRLRWGSDDGGADEVGCARHDAPQVGIDDGGAEETRGRLRRRGMDSSAVSTQCVISFVRSHLTPPALSRPPRLPATLPCRLRVRDSLGAAMGRAALAHVGLAQHCRALPEALAHLQRVVLTGDAPAAFADLSADATLRLRDNEDREVFSSWDPPAPAAVAERRGGGGVGALIGAERAAELAATASEPWQLCSIAAAGIAAAAALPSSAAAALHPMAHWVTGSTGGALERLTRRAARLAAAGVKHAASDVLVSAASDAPARSSAALERLRVLLVGAGYEGAVAPPAPSSCDAGGGRASPHAVDLAAGALRFVDAGVSEPRQSVRAACARILWLAVAACNAACAEAAEGGAAAPACGSRWADVDAGLRELSGRLGSVCAALGASVLVAPGGARPSSGGPQVLRLESLAEASLLSTHTLPHAVWAVAVACRVLARVAGSGGGKGAGKGSKGGSSGASSDAARGAAEAARSLCLSAASALRALSRGLVAAQDLLLATGTPAAAAAAHAAAVGPLDAPACVTALMRRQWEGASAALAAAPAAAAAGGKGGKKVAPPPLPTAGPGDGAPSFATAAAATGGVGASFVAGLVASRGERIRGAVEEAARALRAGHAAMLGALIVDVSARVQALEGLRV